MRPYYHHTRPQRVTHDGVALRLRPATLAEIHDYDGIRRALANRAKGLNDDGTPITFAQLDEKAKPHVAEYLSTAKASVYLA